MSRWILIGRNLYIHLFYHANRKIYPNPFNLLFLFCFLNNNHVIYVLAIFFFWKVTRYKNLYTESIKKNFEGPRYYQINIS